MRVEQVQASWSRVGCPLGIDGTSVEKVAASSKRSSVRARDGAFSEDAGMMIWKRETAAVISLLLWCGCLGAPPHRYGGIAADLPKPGSQPSPSRRSTGGSTCSRAPSSTRRFSTIFDGSGRRLAAERFEGEDDLGG